MSNLDRSPPPKDLKNLAHMFGVLYGTVGNKLWYSEQGKLDYFQRTNNYSFDDTLTALLPTSAGLLVFSENKTWVLRGTNRAEYNVELISADIGCLDMQSCLTVESSPVWVSHGGLTGIKGITPVLISGKVREFGRSLGYRIISGVSWRGKVYYLHGDNKGSQYHFYNWVSVFDFSMGNVSYSKIDLSVFIEPRTYSNRYSATYPGNGRVNTEFGTYLSGRRLADDVYQLMVVDGELSAILATYIPQGNPPKPTDTRHHLLFFERDYGGTNRRISDYIGEILYETPLMTDGVPSIEKSYNKVLISGRIDGTITIETDSGSQFIMSNEDALLRDDLITDGYNKSYRINLPSDFRGTAIKFLIEGRCVIKEILWNAEPVSA